MSKDSQTTCQICNDTGVCEKDNKLVRCSCGKDVNITSRLDPYTAAVKMNKETLRIRPMTQTTQGDFKTVRDFLGYMESQREDPIEEIARQDAISALLRIKEAFND